MYEIKYEKGLQYLNAKNWFEKKGYLYLMVGENIPHSYNILY